MTDPALPRTTRLSRRETIALATASAAFAAAPMSPSTLSA
jgi:hypothetical protein